MTLAVKLVPNKLWHQNMSPCLAVVYLTQRRDQGMWYPHANRTRQKPTNNSAIGIFISVVNVDTSNYLMILMNLKFQLLFWANSYFGSETST